MGLQLSLLFFLSYQDPIHLDIAEVETALFNVKIASRLAVSQNFDKMKPFSVRSLDFYFLMLFNIMDTGTNCWLSHGLNFKMKLFLGITKSDYVFHTQMLFLNKMHIFVIFLALLH